jgi:hypothetical protein
MGVNLCAFVAVCTLVPSLVDASSGVKSHMGEHAEASLLQPTSLSSLLEDDLMPPAPESHGVEQLRALLVDARPDLESDLVHANATPLLSLSSLLEEDLAADQEDEKHASDQLRNYDLV